MTIAYLKLSVSFFLDKSPKIWKPILKFWLISITKLGEFISLAFLAELGMSFLFSSNKCFPIWKKKFFS